MSTSFVRSPFAGNASADEIVKWSVIAEQVADAVATTAAERDRTSARPFEVLQLLRDSGLTNLIVPTEFGGYGGHWETALLVTRIIARVDASAAQVLGYHWLNQACVTFYGPDEARQARWYTESAAAKWMWSDSFNPVSPDLAIEAEGENYRLTGFKKFATGASVADIIIAGGVATGGAFDGELIVFALNNDREGVEHIDDWDHLGYRSSASGSVRYTNVLITPEDIIGADKDEPFSSIVTPGVQLLFGNVYLGIAQGALEQAKELTLARKNSWFLSGVDTYAQDPITQRAFGDLVSKTVAVEALADKLNRHFDDVVALGGKTTADDRANLEIKIAQLKVVSTDVALDVANRVYELTGASSTHSSVGLDRHWRDIRTHSLHDPVDYKRIEVGNHFLNGAFAPISLYT
jgi:alkylation response protein AidB-like acyl-CoA dehydrogenase